VPYGTVPVFARIPGNKLPGYDLKSLRDNKPSVPVHIFDSTSLLEDEDDDEDEDD
jgi:hypothetical protein